MNLFSRRPIDKAMDDAARSLEGLDPSSEEFTRTANNIKTLGEAKAYKKADRPRLDPNKVLACGAYLVVGIIALDFERYHVIASKVWARLPKIM